MSKEEDLFYEITTSQNDFKWNVYKKFGCSLRMVDSILLCNFDANEGIPADVITLGNGTKIKKVRPSIELLLSMGNDIKWEVFLCNQPTWIRELLYI